MAIIGDMGTGQFAPVPSPGYKTKPQRQIITSPPPPKYYSIAEVAKAYQTGPPPTYNDAYNILRNQFGLSDGEATDVLTVELETITTPPPQLPIGPSVLPGDWDGDGVPDEDDTNQFAPDVLIEPDNEEVISKRIRQNDRFKILGMAILILGWIKLKK